MPKPTPNPAEPQIPLPPARQKRNRIWLAAALVLVTLGALLTWFIVANVRDTAAVVVVRTDIARGATISAQDLTTAEINPDPNLRTVPASQLAQVVGKRAAVDLRAGTLLSAAAFADELIPPTGSSVVGLALSPGQMPAAPLQVGDKVRIISTPKDQDDPPTADPVVSITAQIVSTSQLTDTQKTQVDVLVSNSDAAAVAGIAATNRVALILDSSQR